MELSWTLLRCSWPCWVAWFWHDSLGARERANGAAIETCRRTGAASRRPVAFRRLRDRGIARAAAATGRPRFDYTRDGATRQQGSVVLTERTVDTVGPMAPRAYPLLRPRGLSSRPASPSDPRPAHHGAVSDNVDRELFRNIERLRQLRIEHRDLDDVIHRLQLDMRVDEIQLKRLKKRKLLLKDQIARLESQMIPDLNA